MRARLVAPHRCVLQSFCLLNFIFEAPPDRRRGGVSGRYRGRVHAASRSPAYSLVLLNSLARTHASNLSAS